MDSTISNALLLMLIGMVSVSLVLTIVVVGGSILIKFVNTYFPELTKQESQRTVVGPSRVLDAKTIAVLSGVVSSITNGKGRIVEITKDSNRNK